MVSHRLFIFLKARIIFQQIDLNTLANSFVRNAEVYVSNGTLTHKLKEYTVPVGGGYNFYYYSNDPQILLLHLSVS